MEPAKLLNYLLFTHLLEHEREKIKTELINCLKQGAKSYEERQEVRRFVCMFLRIMYERCHLKEKIEEATQFFKETFNDTFGLEDLKFSDITERYCENNYYRQKEEVLFKKLKEGNVDEECLEILGALFIAVDEILAYNRIVLEASSVVADALDSAVSNEDWDSVGNLYELEGYIINRFLVEINP